MAQKPKDSRSDEALVRAFGKGEAEALDILLERYATIILAYLFNHSFFQDEAYLLDVRQQIFLTLFKSMRQFRPRGPGSFRKWLYTVAHHECLNQDKKRRRALKPVSQFYPQEATGFPDDLVPRLRPQTTAYEAADQRIDKVFKCLTPTEQRLMQMVGEGRKHKQILKDPAFSKYSLAYLKLKIYNIRQKLIKKAGKL